MFCPKCGKQLADDCLFCASCGTPLHSNSTDADWYYISDSSKIGPVKKNDLVSAIKQSAITEDTLVWRNGFKDWLPAGQTEVSALLHQHSPVMPKGMISDKWQWALATAPLLSSFILAAMGLGAITLITTIGLNCLFLSLDIKELKKNGYEAESWLWLGLLLVPVYLFIRASKTNKRYAPGIVWCALFVLDLIA